MLTSCLNLIVTNIGRTGATNCNVNGLISIGTNLELRIGETAIQQFPAVKAGRIGNAVELIFQLDHFGLQKLTVLRGVRIISRLNGQLTNTLQQVPNLTKGAFCGLRQRNTVIGVTLSHSQAANLRVETGGNCQTRSVVFSRVDPQTGRQALQCLVRQRLGLVQLILRVQGCNVSVDTESHDASP